MISGNTDFINSFITPVRSIGVMAYLNNADGKLDKILAHDNNLISMTYERIGVNNKFYGFGICQKVNLRIRDIQRAINPTTEQHLQILIGNDSGYTHFSPRMYITETHRDEITNELSITAYDAIYKMSADTVNDLGLTSNMTLAMYAGEAAGYYGLLVSIRGDDTPFLINYAEIANFDGAETLRQLMDAVAEATQSIYYCDIDDNIIFRQLDRDGEAVYTIDREQYFTLDSGNNRRLAAICHTTELGDSITSALEVSGTTQYIRDNPFYELRTDTHTLLDNALALMGGLTINQFECDWRGNPIVEIGDKLALITKDNETAYTYLLDDVIDYDGTYRQITRWRYEDDTADTADNPTNLGEALYKTYAKVDKANRDIEIVASEAEANSNNIAALQLNTESITASVSKVEENINTTISGVNENIATLSNRVDAAMTAEGVKISIQEELANGVDKVYTSTGFSFDADGLRVSKTGSEMESLLDEDGLSVYRDNVEVLTADNTGVNGINMTVRQYLIVGGSRFEAYGSDRTGCFWIG